MKDPVWWWFGLVRFVFFSDNNTYPSLGLGLRPLTSTSTGVWQKSTHILNLQDKVYLYHILIHLFWYLQISQPARELILGLALTTGVYSTVPADTASSHQMPTRCSTFSTITITAIMSSLYWLTSPILSLAPVWHSLLPPPCLCAAPSPGLSSMGGIGGTQMLAILLSYSMVLFSK